MKGNRIASICAYASLAISVVMMLLWGCNVGGFTVVSLDSFVGVIVALLAIVVTFAIAWQIYNVMEIRNKVEQLNQLEDRLIKQEKSLEQMNYNAEHEINSLLCFGAYKDKAYLASFRFALESLNNGMKLESPRNIDTLLELMENITKSMTSETKDEYGQFDLIMKIDKEIKSHSNYDFIKVRYEETLNVLTSKVKRHEKKQ